jgi:hypothetical protein
MGRAAARGVREQAGCERMLEEVQALYDQTV